MLILESDRARENVPALRELEAHLAGRLADVSRQREALVVKRNRAASYFMKAKVEVLDAEIGDIDEHQLPGIDSQLSHTRLRIAKDGMSLLDLFGINLILGRMGADFVWDPDLFEQRAFVVEHKLAGAEGVGRVADHGCRPAVPRSSRLSVTRLMPAPVQGRRHRHGHDGQLGGKHDDREGARVEPVVEGGAPRA